MKHYSSKILLFGEYTLLFGSNALALPFNKYGGHWDYLGPDASGLALASNRSLKKFAAFVAERTTPHFTYNSKQFLDDVSKGLYFKSTIKQGYGLGSSGSLVAAFFSTYVTNQKPSLWEGTTISPEQIQTLRGELSSLESFFHGTSSGIDPLTVLLNKPTWVKTLEDITTTSVPPSNEASQDAFFLMNTGIKRNTDGLVGHFKNLCTNPTFKSAIDEELVPLVNSTINDFLNNDKTQLYRHLKQLVSFQLDRLSFLIPQQIQQLTQKGLETNKYYLKICGAGGGGYALGFTSQWEQTKSELADYNIELIEKY